MQRWIEGNPAAKPRQGAIAIRWVWPIIMPGVHIGELRARRQCPLYKPWIPALANSRQSVLTIQSLSQRPNAGRAVLQPGVKRGPLVTPRQCILPSGCCHACRDLTGVILGMIYHIIGKAALKAKSALLLPAVCASLQTTTHQSSTGNDAKTPSLHTSRDHGLVDVPYERPGAHRAWKLAESRLMQGRSSLWSQAIEQQRHGWCCYHTAGGL